MDFNLWFVSNIVQYYEYNTKKKKNHTKYQ